MKKIAVLAFAVLTAMPAAAATSQPKLARNAFPEPMPQTLASVIQEAAQQYRLDPNLLAAMAYKESRFRPHAVSSRGAQGVMQLMPRTAKYLGVTDSFDVRQNVFGGAKYLRKMLDRFNGDVEMSLAAYNAGPERVAREGKRATAEAVDYVAAITSFYRNATRAL